MIGTPLREQMLAVVTPRWRGDAAALEGTAAQPLRQLMLEAGFVHFASFALLPARPGDGDPTPSLLLELSLDEGIAPAVAIGRLVTLGVAPLMDVYGGYPGAPPAGGSARQDWLNRLLLRHLYRADGGYVGARDRTVAQIHREAALLRQGRARQRELAKPAETAAMAALLAGSMAATPGAVARRSFWRTPRGRILRWPATVALALLLLPWTLVLVLLGAANWLGARFDRPDPRVEVPRAHQVHPSLEACEARLLHRPNHMISLTEVRRPYRFNAMMARLFLRSIAWIGHVWFTEGQLGKAAGIQFGRWHLIDGDRRLLFCASFDGSFGGYLDEFILGAALGTNLSWRWTELLPRPAAAGGQPAVLHPRRFPRTVLLALRGCRHEQWFKAFARESMLPHLWRFEAYEHGFADIARATRFNDALYGARNAVNDDRMMRAIES